MASLRVNNDPTPEEEFEEVAERIYKKLDKSDIEDAETKPELIKIIEDYMGEKAFHNLVKEMPRVFEKKGYWKEKEIKVVMPKELPVETEVEKEPVKIDLTPFKKPTRKAKRIKIKIGKGSTDEDLTSYVDSRPSRVKKDKIYKVTRSGKYVKRDVYLKRLKNLSKGWSKKKTGLS